MGADGPSDRSLLLLLPGPVRTLPVDLVAVVVLVLLACLFVVVPGLNETPLRVVFGLPLVLFLPGYALVAALFPGSPFVADCLPYPASVGQRHCERMSETTISVFPVLKSGEPAR